MSSLKHQTSMQSSVGDRAADALFASLDLDHDGLLSRKELAGALLTFGLAPTPSNIEAVMQTFDTDGDGMVSEIEFREGLKTLQGSDEVHTSLQQREKRLLR
jgi:Ca2+-binding EF-hand superfamily protein